MIGITGTLPVLAYGAEDIPGKPMWIKRAQLITGAEPDGVYGPETARRIAAWMKDDPKRTTTNGRRIALPEWRRLFGIW
jgi:hypothetical protein